MNERPEMSSNDPAHTAPLRLVAAERVGRMQREVAAAAAVDLRTPEAPAGQPATVVTSANRVEALHSAVVALAARVQDLSVQTQSFSEILTSRHLDYSDQVRRLSLVAEQSLTEHREAVAERDATVERMADAVGHVSRDLAGILEHVMASLRQSRDVATRNEELSHQLTSGFSRASQQLTKQGQDLRDEMARLLPKAGAASGPTGDVDALRAEMHGALAQLRDDIGSDVAGLRRLLSRNRKEAPAPAEELEALRVDISTEMEGLVHELHDDQVLMMREILASQKEIKKLRDDVARAGARPSNGNGDGGGGVSAQLENEMNRLLIELRALRRRPFIDPRKSDDGDPAEPTTATPRPRARLAPTARSQWAGRPMQRKSRPAR